MSVVIPHREPSRSFSTVSGPCSYFLANIWESDLEWQFSLRRGYSARNAPQNSMQSVCSPTEKGWAWFTTQSTSFLSAYVLSLDLNVACATPFRFCEIPPEIDLKWCLISVCIGIIGRVLVSMAWWLDAAWNSQCSEISSSASCFFCAHQVQWNLLSEESQIDNFTAHLMLSEVPSTAVCSRFLYDGMWIYIFVLVFIMFDIAIIIVTHDAVPLILKLKWNVYWAQKPYLLSMMMFFLSNVFMNKTCAVFNQWHANSESIESQRAICVLFILPTRIFEQTWLKNGKYCQALIMRDGRRSSRSAPCRHHALRMLDTFCGTRHAEIEIRYGWRKRNCGHCKYCEQSRIIYCVTV